MSDSNIAGNILQILAGLPEFLRKPMLKNRLTEFFTLPEDERKETVANALNAAPAIDFNVLSNLVKTWMEVLCEFNEDRRRAMFGAYVDVIAVSPEIIAKLNVDGFVSLFNSLPDDKKEILASSLNDLIADLPSDRRRKFVDAIPETAKKVLKISFT
jgi:Mg/Co/Ni transporter MgtE